MKTLKKNMKIRICPEKLVQALTGIFCSILQNHTYDVPRRIFDRRIDLDRSRYAQLDCERSKSRKTDFWPKNGLILVVFRSSHRQNLLKTSTNLVSRRFRSAAQDGINGQCSNPIVNGEKSRKSPKNRRKCARRQFFAISEPGKHRIALKII